jgi:hypothetical protein
MFPKGKRKRSAITLDEITGQPRNSRRYNAWLPENRRLAFAQSGQQLES